MHQYFQPNFQVCRDFDTPVVWQMLTNIWQDSLHLEVKVMQISLTQCVSYRCLTWSSYPKQSHLPHFLPKLLQRRKHKSSPQRNAIASTTDRVSVLSSNKKNMDKDGGSSFKFYFKFYMNLMILSVRPRKKRKHIFSLVVLRVITWLLWHCNLNNTQDWIHHMLMNLKFQFFYKQQTSFYK